MKNQQIPEIPCSVCDKLFLPKTHNNLTCSDECCKIRKKKYNELYNKGYNKEYRKASKYKSKRKEYDKRYNEKLKLQKTYITKKCVICGKEYNSKPKDRKITCSDECDNSRVKNYMSNYRNSNKEKVNERYKQDKQFRLRQCISSAIRKSLKGNKNGMSWEGLVDYTLQDLIIHLEERFEPWMNWNNYGMSVSGERTWSIDHIKPVSLFEFDSYEDEEFKKCWALDNLQPMDLIENMSKGDSYGN